MKLRISKLVDLNELNNKCGLSFGDNGLIKIIKDKSTYSFMFKGKYENIRLLKYFREEGHGWWNWIDHYDIKDCAV